jgi:hypothetical protein
MRTISARFNQDQGYYYTDNNEITACCPFVEALFNKRPREIKIHISKEKLHGFYAAKRIYTNYVSLFGISTVGEKWDKVIDEDGTVFIWRIIGAKLNELMIRNSEIFYWKVEKA